MRRRLPPLNRPQLARLSPALRARHTAWQQEQLLLPAGEQQLRLARQLALSLLELGEGYDATERQLLRWHYPTRIAREAAAWAAAQRCSGLSGQAEMGDGAVGEDDAEGAPTDGWVGAHLEQR